MQLGPRATNSLLRQLGAFAATGRRVGLRCPIRDDQGFACNGSRASVDGAGRFTCPRCRSSLDPLELTMRVRGLSREAAAEWIGGVLREDESVNARRVPETAHVRVSERWMPRRNRKNAARITSNSCVARPRRREEEKENPKPPISLTA
jgi:hypothetical protein